MALILSQLFIMPSGFIKPQVIIKSLVFILSLVLTLSQVFIQTLVFAVTGSSYSWYSSFLRDLSCPWYSRIQHFLGDIHVAGILLLKCISSCSKYFTLGPWYLSCPWYHHPVPGISNV
jgi:hypothetical protein